MQPATEFVRHKLTVNDYHQIAEAGILTADDRVELIEGELIDMAPIGSPHADYVDRLAELLISQVHGKFRVRIQNPIQLDNYSEPEPDVVIAKDRSYREAHPGPQDILLLIEVADTTLKYDRNIKIPLYARSGIPEVWLIDIQNQRLEIHRQPSQEGYRQILLPASNEAVSPLLVDGVSIRMAEL
ncbi:MAG: Uma2 family endonuclease [Candidatus Competibacteraceae bacterium]